MDIGVNGAAGAMGLRVIALAAEADDCTVVAALEREGHPDLGRDVGNCAGVGPLGVSLISELTVRPDVLVDFSRADATMARARECGGMGVPLVVGTTGLSDQQRTRLREETAARVPLLLASNMSLGVNLLFRVAERVAEALPSGYDIEIVEAHHRRKKDAPSGTAMELAERLCQRLGRDSGVLRFGREGITGERDAEEIGVHSLRGGGIVGEHTVIFAGSEERIELVHRAGSRDVFARGALEAARFLAEAEPGFYTMEDVLN